MIKYLGSKRLMTSLLGDVAVATGARSAVDLFTGTTRVAQEFKRRGLEVTAADVASYSGVLSDCFIATDAATIDRDGLDEEIARLNALPGVRGYFTETFCEESRFFQPRNGARVDAIRDAVEEHRGTPLFPILLTSLMLAADRVDSTIGVQMAYLKEWAPRAQRELQLVVPELIAGPGATVVGDATRTIDLVPSTDLMYLDPPYNQHRYFTNYHIWETLVRWDSPEAYGIARKRLDSRDDATKSVFNRRRTMPSALRRLVRRARAEVLVVSYNDESWITAEEMTELLRDGGYDDVRIVGFDSKRYVGAQLGIHNGAGEKVGTVSHLRNTEYLFIAGPAAKVAAAVAAAERRTTQTAGARRGTAIP